MLPNNKNRDLIRSMNFRNSTNQLELIPEKPMVLRDIKTKSTLPNLHMMSHDEGTNLSPILRKVQTTVMNPVKRNPSF